MPKFPFIYFMLALIFFGCKDKEFEQRLLEKEKELNLRETAILESENELASLRQFKDSLEQLNQPVDTLVTFTEWPDSLQGIWNSKVICTKSDCADYLVGDQRSDQWKFTQDSTRIMVEVFNQKNEMVRVYNAEFDQKEIKLNFQTNPSSTKNVEMEILLNSFKKNRMSGTRTIKVNQNCLASFSVELTKMTTKNN